MGENTPLDSEIEKYNTELMTLLKNLLVHDEEHQHQIHSHLPLLQCTCDDGLID